MELNFFLLIFPLYFHMMLWVAMICTVVSFVLGNEDSSSSFQSVAGEERPPPSRHFASMKYKASAALCATPALHAFLLLFLLFLNGLLCANDHACV